MSILEHRLRGPLGEPEIQDLRHRFGQWLEALGAPRDDVYAAVGVLDEFACNLMEHSGAGWIELKAYNLDGRIHVALRDNGKSFDPTALIKKDYSDYLKSDTDRKLGLFMVGRLTDDLRYEREEPDGVNCLTYMLKFKGWEAPD